MALRPRPVALARSRAAARSRDLERCRPGVCRGAPLPRRAACAWLGLSLLVTELAVADSDVLARVGAIEIDAATFRRRAELVTALDRAELGSTWPEQRRRLLEEVLIADALLAESGAQPALGLPAARDRALGVVLEAELAREAFAAPSAARAQAYRDRHQRELTTPRSLSLWRILVSSEADARALIASLSPPTEAAFSRLARDRSLDTATRMRAGNLGRVFADGDTLVPELRVAAGLFAAADRVGDGELVAEPVAEGSAHAVVWRRASHPERALASAEVEALVAARLADERRAELTEALLQALRREHLAEYHPERVLGHEPRFEQPRNGRPVAPEGPRRPARLAPEPTERGLR